MSSTALRETSVLSRVSFHQGRALLRLAETYPFLEDVILEQIQNALDAHATSVHVVVDKKKRTVVVRDNGDGASIAKFDNALTQICMTQKTDDALGRFGLGVISPLGKCERFIFTSCSRTGRDGYQRWEFDSEKVASQKTEVFIPRTSLPNQTFDKSVDKTQERAGKRHVNWRTEVIMQNVTKDKFVSKVTMDSLVSALLEKYGPVMYERDAVASILIRNEDGTEERRSDVRGQKFRGRGLKAVELQDSNGGTTVFHLGIAPKQGKERSGKVLIGESRNPFRLSFVTFARSILGLLPADAADALSSGIFEGEITNSKITLHPNRKSFVQNDALVGLCESLESWYESIGKNYVEEVKESGREERYQRLGQKSAKFFAAMLRDPNFSDLAKLIQSFPYGSIGKGHLEPDSSSSEDEQRSVSVDSKTRRRPGDSHDSDREGPEETHSSHTPVTVKGPRGQRRTIVRGDSQGLNFEYDHLVGSMKDLWDFQDRTGTLIISTVHPQWAELEGSESRLMRFQEIITMHALSYAAAPSEWKKVYKQYADEQLRLASYWLLHGDQITGRFGGGRTGTPK